MVAHRGCGQQGLSLHDIDTPVPEVTLCERPAISQNFPRDSAFAPNFASQSV